MMKKAGLILGFLLGGGIIFAQEHVALKAARKLVNMGLYYEAAENYKKAYAAEPENKDLVNEYADVLFFNLEDYAAAYPLIQQSLAAVKDTDVVFLYGLAKCEHYLEKFPEATVNFRRVLKKIGKARQYSTLKDEVEAYLENIDYALKNDGAKSKKRLKVVNAGKNVNTQYEEYVPVTDSRENFLMFTSKRKNKFNRSPGGDDEKYHEDMYVSQRSGNNFSSAEILPSSFNSVKNIVNSKANESLVSLSPDGNTLFLYKEGTLWKSSMSGGAWGTPELLDKKIIGNDYDNHISITGDGNEVYFTSEKKGGQGGTDIYVCRKLGNAEWSAPENMGKKFNTKGNEQSPFISKDGKKIWFASDKRGGYGGYDIYYSSFDGKNWSDPENMGKPVNSTANDIFFYPNEDASEGYLSSNRSGSIGGYDIFRFYDMDNPSFGSLNLKNRSQESDTVKTSEVEELLKKKMASGAFANVFFRVNDSLVVSGTGVDFSAFKSGSKIEIVLVKDCDTCLYRSEENFVFVLEPRIAPPEDVEEFPQPSKVFFSFNSAEISAEGKVMLEKMVSWLKEHPEKNISLAAHADIRGTSRYNLLLSEKRASSVEKFLLANNILPGRIILKTAYGSKHASSLNPMNDLANDRRVDIIVSGNTIAKHP